MTNHDNSPEPPVADALTDEDEDAPLPSLTATCRRDGWTPFARRLFLEVLAETGRVTTACEYTQLTKQSAYALRARDPAFAASWDAACELARAPLADALYERAMDGVTETISKDGEVVATRHRFDARLSVAVLHRLDKRCDRAMETGARHLALVRRWDEWIDLVGKGEDQAAHALLESANPQTASHGQFGQLPLGANPTMLETDRADDDEDDDDEGLDLTDRCWQRDEMGEKVWMTDFPPPPGFTGWQNRLYDEDRDLEAYERECTPEEVAALQADEAAAAAAERAEEEELRDQWFQLLRAAASDADAQAAPEQDEEPRGAGRPARSDRTDEQPQPACPQHAGPDAGFSPVTASPPLLRRAGAA